MKRISSGLLLSALALGTVAVFASAPAGARPAIVERLAELNTRGTQKDHGGLAFNSRTLSDDVEQPETILTASGNGFDLAGDGIVNRPAIVRRLAALNARGTDKDHSGLSFNSRTLR